MSAPITFNRPQQRGIIADCFAGGGGASLGFEMVGLHVDVAVNHSRAAVAMHRRNHPHTRHHCEDIWKVNPLHACDGRRCWAAWFSPDCTDHSNAKGGKPKEKKRRILAHAVIRWVRTVRPDVLFLENVIEFLDWGPLHRKPGGADCLVCGREADGRRCPVRVGQSFRRWVSQLRNLGYAVEWRTLVASDFGAPTSRKRLFLIARCDGQPIVWPEPTHGRRLLPYRTAAECIDWRLPCPSIFLTREDAKQLGFNVRRPLAPNTLARIARGVKRYVLDNPTPFVVGIDHASNPAASWPVGAPLTTVTTVARHALIAPSMVHVGNGERDGQAPRVYDIQQPLGTIVCAKKHGLVAALLAQNFGGNYHGAGAQLTLPLPTITCRDHHSLVAAELAAAGQADRRPDVRAFLTTYYSTDQDTQLHLPLPTVTCKPRFGVVLVGGVEYEIADIGMRMLSPRELYRAQGFPEDYVIDLEVDGQPLTQEEKVELVGNSVVPHLAAALAQANLLGELEAVA